MSSAEAPGISARSSSTARARFPVTLTDCTRASITGLVARLPCLFPNELQLAVQIVPRPPDLVAVAVGQRAAQPAKAYYIGVPGSRAEYERVPAANGKLDPVTSWQAVQPRPAQRQMPAVVGDGVSSQESRDRSDEFGQALCPLVRAGPVLASIRPFARRMTCTDAEEDPPGREDVEVAASAATCIGSRTPACITQVPNIRVCVTAAALPSAGHGEAPEPGWSPIASPRKPPDSRRLAKLSHERRSVGSACTLTAISGMRRTLPASLPRKQAVRRPVNTTLIPARRAQRPRTGLVRQPDSSSMGLEGITKATRFRDPLLSAVAISYQLWRSLARSSSTVRAALPGQASVPSHDRTATDRTRGRLAG